MINVRRLRRGTARLLGRKDPAQYGVGWIDRPSARRPDGKPNQANTGTEGGGEGGGLPAEGGRLSAVGLAIISGPNLKSGARLGDAVGPGELIGVD